MKYENYISLAVVSLDAFAKRIPIFFWAVFFTEIGLSGIQQGWLFSASMIAGLILTIPIGLTNDKLQPKTLLIFGFMLATMRYIGISITENYWAIFFFFTIGGIGLHINKVSIDSLIYKKSSGADSHKKMAPFLSFLFIFGALGFMAGGYIINTFSFKTMLLIMSWLIVGLLLLSLALPKFGTVQFKIRDYIQDIKNPSARWFGLFMLLFTFHFGAEVTSYALFLKNNLALNTYESGLYMGSAVLIMGAVSYYTSSKISGNKKLLKKVVIAGLLLSGINHILMTIPTTVSLSLFFRILHEIGDAFVITFMYNQAVRLFPSERSGGGSGMFNLIAILGASCGSFVYGPIGEAYGYHYPLIISGVLILAITPLLLADKKIIS